MGITSQADGTGWNLEAVHTGITKTKTGGAAMHMAPQIPHPHFCLPSIHLSGKILVSKQPRSRWPDKDKHFLLLVKWKFPKHLLH